MIFTENKIEIVQAAINYIESNLLEDMDLDGVANCAHVSLSHLYRVFPMLTGVTVKEYIRLRRMSKAAVELRCGEESILDISIKYGFNSQESFLKVFHKLFGITPGEYRKTGKPITLLEKKDILRDFIHKASHESLQEGVYKKLDVNTFTIFKPAHKWIAKVNRDNWSDFYEECEKRGIMEIIDNIPSDRRYGGGLMTIEGFKTMIVCYGKEVPADYEGEVPEFCEVFDFPASKYIVFNHIPYPPEDHGSVIHSVYAAAENFKPEDYGFSWNAENLPIYNDDDEFGFTVSCPVREL